MRGLPPEIEVRRAGPADSAAVFAFVHAGLESYRAWAPDTWRPPEVPAERRPALEALFEGDDAWILLAFEGGELAGVVSLARHTVVSPSRPPEGTMYLWQLFVAPAWQGRGLAGALLDRALDEAAKRGMRRLTLWAAAGATQARRFYEREGWQPTGAQRDDQPFGLPVLEYELALPDS